MRRRHSTVVVLAKNCVERIVLNFTDNLIYTKNYFLLSENRFPLVHLRLRPQTARQNGRSHSSCPVLETLFAHPHAQRIFARLHDIRPRLTTQQRAVLYTNDHLLSSRSYVRARPPACASVLRGVRVLLSARLAPPTGFSVWECRRLYFIRTAFGCVLRSRLLTGGGKFFG